MTVFFIYFEIPDVPLSFKSDVWKRFRLPRFKRQERRECDRQPSRRRCQSSANAAVPLHFHGRSKLNIYLKHTDCDSFVF